MTNQDILRIALEQQAIDNSCSPEDFLKDENVVVISKPHEKARRYLNLPFFCDLVTYGSNVVASVDERVFPFVKDYINAQPTEHCFQTPSIQQLTMEFAKYGYMPCFQAQYWLPDMRVLQELPCPYPIKILEPAEFQDLYVSKWSNALSGHRKERDMLAAGAYDGDTMIGLAGCCADGDTMWQIGIDVLPDYRHQGIASALTAKLALEIIGRGKVPFYCCAWSNIPSSRNAYKSGFRPAWAEHTAISIDKVMEMLPLHETEAPEKDALPLTLCPLEDADIPLMSQWLQQPYIKKWYDPIDGWLDEIRERHSTYSWLHHFIVYDGAIPIGFGQYYDCFDSVGLEQWKGREFTKRGEVYSIDYLIGDKRYLGKGYGRQMVELLTNTVFALGAKEIIVDPDESNVASQGVLVANGYTFNEEQGYYVISDGALSIYGSDCGTT